MHHFCTYFDSRYLPRGLALHRSLMRHCASFTLWVLCMDSASRDILGRMALPSMRLIPMGEFERGDAPLRAAKENRSQLEYYWTCTPSLPLYILENRPEVDRITYLDADLHFFSSPEPIYEEMGENSILIVGHRFSPEFRRYEEFGKYNVGLLSFRRDEAGLECVRWWRERCLEYCCYRSDAGRFADQKYLDDWPSRFPGVAVLQHKGAGLAPWNIGNYALGLDGGRVTVEGQPLVFYHFHGLRQVARWVYDPGLVNYRTRLSRVGRQHIYTAYIRELQEMSRRVNRVARRLDVRSDTWGRREKLRPPRWKRSLPQLVEGLKRRINMIHGLSRGDLLFAPNR